MQVIDDLMIGSICVERDLPIDHRLSNRRTRIAFHLRSGCGPDATKSGTTFHLEGSRDVRLNDSFTCNLRFSWHTPDSIAISNYGAGYPLTIGSPGDV